MTTTLSGAATNHSPTRLLRTLVLLYSLAAYVIGSAALLWLIISLTSLYPLTASPFIIESQAAAVLFNIGLLLLFGLQHSIMARPAFKQWWTRRIVPAAERSTYVLGAGVTLSLLVWLWQPVEGLVWSVSQPEWRMALWGLFIFGWLYLLAATYVTNHYDLFGLRQAWLYLRGKPYTPVPFVRRWMYRYSRHPMMAGILLGIWATPQMSASHLVLAMGFTLYIAIGVAFEERELLEQFGDKYLYYRKQAGALLPRIRG